MKTSHIAIAALLGAALAQACSTYSGAGPTAPGQTPPPQRIVALSGEVDRHIPEFGALVGAVNNKNERGFHAAGRREINWDGVPAQFTNTSNFPANFFNVNAPRGAVYVSPAGLRVSDNHFADINPTYAKDLIPFSNPRMFAPIGTTRFELTFRIPGTDTVAAVRAFGAVVVDVDKPNTSRLQAYDKNGTLIADVPVPVRKDPDEYSLVGVTFDAPVIARVALTLGDAPIGPDVDDVSSGGMADVVVLDDFLYSEPQPLQ